ncbi:hypothetical protein FQR65_LT09954 [Abscondita terminalis]|nr:hypothetical protein FQR65_LT09954 [Abscondita terminalis]
MIKWIFILVVLRQLPSAWSYGELRISDLPHNTVDELKTILKNEELKVNCSDHFERIKLTFVLYNRTNVVRCATLADLNFIGGNSLIVIFPGWLTSPTSLAIQELKAAYLSRYNTNILIMDWPELQFAPYTHIFCNVPNVAFQISKFLCDLSNLTDIQLSNVHIIGYSFGAHIAGYLGRTTILQCNQKIGRITGLDPAGPIYKHLSEAQRLYITDALFVDVIYTSPNFGIPKKCGNVNIRSNCFQNQPGCSVIHEINSHMLLSDCMCSTLRSIQLMTESINSNQLIAVSCSKCSNMCLPDSFIEIYVTVGEDCEQPSEPVDNFIIFTRDNAPYGQGMVPYTIV